MTIIGALTPVIKNGDTEDATVVMALFAFIQSQVNNAISTYGQSLIGAADAPTARGLLVALSPADVQSQIYTSFTTGGTSSAYTLTPSPALTSYVAGASFFVNFQAASLASPTLQISGLASPPALLKELGNGTFAAIGAGDIPYGHRSRVTILNSSNVLVETLPTRAVGDGQTWTDVSGSRAFNTNYTNSTGRPIVITASCYTNTSGLFYMYILIGGVQINGSQGNYPGAPPLIELNTTAVVPAGATYNIVTNSVNTLLVNWAELR